LFTIHRVNASELGYNEMERNAVLSEEEQWLFFLLRWHVIRQIRTAAMRDDTADRIDDDDDDGN